MVISALDQALAERADGNALPEGVGIVDAPTLAQLRADAEVGRTHRERELTAAAIHRGQIPPAARASWEQLSPPTRPQHKAALSKIKPGTIPISAVGYSDTNEERDELYGRVFGD